MTIDIRLHVPLLYLQMLLCNPCLQCRIIFIEIRHFGVNPPPVLVAFDGNRLDQYCFFRHDFVLAAVAAGFELRAGELVELVMRMYFVMLDHYFYKVCKAMIQSMFLFLGGTFLMSMLTACNQSQPVGDVAELQASKASSSQKIESNGLVREFVARGNEPFWTIKANGTTLTWITPENLQGSQLKVDKVISADNVKYVGVDGDNDFTLLIIQAPCVDTMSGETFDFTSVWTHGREKNVGCAASGR